MKFLLVHLDVLGCLGGGAFIVDCTLLRSVRHQDRAALGQRALVGGTGFDPGQPGRQPRAMPCGIEARQQRRNGKTHLEIGQGQVLPGKSDVPF